MTLSSSPPQPPQHLIERTVRVASPPEAFGSATAGWRRRVVRYRVESPAASWLRSAISEVEGLTGLQRGWDSYNGAPVSASTATKAVAFLVDNAFAELSKPSVVPLNDGGIQLEWHRGGVDLEISFSDHESGVYLEDVGTENSQEAPISEARAVLLNNLRRLAE